MQNVNCCVIINTKLENETRKNRLIKLVEEISSISQFSFSIRIRGHYSEEAYLELEKIFASNKLADFRLYQGDEFKQWKMNTLKQVLDCDLDNFLLLQEDHFLVSDQSLLINVVNQFISHDVEFGHITAWHTYKDFRELISQKSKTLKKDDVIITELINEPWPVNYKQTKRYIISLVGFFNRDKLIEILLELKPYWRKFPVFSPFDFERGPSTKWIYPIKLGFTNKEIFGCIDDDIGVPNSSLHSRGLYPLDTVRVSEHQLGTSIGIQRDLFKLKTFFFPKLKFNSIHDTLKFSLAQISWSYLANFLIKLSRFADSIFYSTHNIFNYIFNQNERKLRNSITSSKFNKIT